MKKILVTGGSGFIGYHTLAPLVARGYQVHAVRTRVRHESIQGINWHEADLLDTQRVGELMARIKPSHLLHMAWYVVPGKVIENPDNMRWMQASLELVRAFREHGGQRLVLSGSCYEYDWRYGYCVEDLTPTTPNTFYGTCKINLHRTIADFSRVSGMSYASGRAFFLYGPREHPDRLASSVVRALLQDRVAKCSHGMQIRDYLYVEDVAEALVHLVDSEYQGACNIGSGQTTTLRDIVQRIGAIMGKPHLLEFGAIPARFNDAPMVIADTTRLNHTVQWKPRFSLDDGIQRTIEWWRNQLSQT